LIGVAIPLESFSDEDKALQTLSPLDVLDFDQSTERIKQAITFVANNTGIDKNTMIALADCESGFRDICIVDTNGKLSCGFYMFQESTLKHFCPDLKWGQGHIKDNIICAGRMIRDGLMKAHWVNCTNKILK
jgi:hypothetical protein